MPKVNAGPDWRKQNSLEGGGGLLSRRRGGWLRVRVRKGNSRRAMLIIMAMRCRAHYHPVSLLRKPLLFAAAFSAEECCTTLADELLAEPVRHRAKPGRSPVSYRGLGNSCRVLRCSMLYKKGNLRNGLGNP